MMLRAAPKSTAKITMPFRGAKLAGDDTKLPTEFRLFVSGWNKTEKGDFLFDEKAAGAVMAAYEVCGVDLMIDLEHQSLDGSSSPDPTSRDARGWCNLELREDGSLWAVNVKWTADGAARLTEKRQRYISPAFGFETDSRRVTNILNVAITSMPATHDTPALIAARKVAHARDYRKLSTGPAFSDVQMAIGKALRDRFPAPPDVDPYDYCGPWTVDVFDASVVFELQGKLYELAYTFDGSQATLGPTHVEVIRSYTPATPAATTTQANKRTRTAKLAADGGTKMDPKLVSKAVDVLEKGDAKGALDILKGLLVSAAGGDPAASEEEKPKPDAPAPAATNATPPAPEDEEKKKDAAMAAASLAIALTGKPDVGSAMAELSRRSKLAVDVEERESKLAADRDKLDAGERRRLVGQLVKLGVEIPATAWADDKGTVPCPRLANEPLEELRARVATLSAAPNVTRAAEPLTPPNTPAANGNGTAALTAEQLAICAELGCKPEDFAALSTMTLQRS